MYRVDFWLSHPDNDADDCIIGFDFDNRDAALDYYNRSEINSYARSCEYIEIDGPDINQVKRNPHYKPSRPDNEWRQEFAHQAGMMGGIEAYNDAIGV